MRTNYNTGNLSRVTTHLKGKRVLLLTTSTRWEGSEDEAKSTMLAKKIQEELGESAKIIDVTKLNIYQCEGNVSTEKGNHCGTKDSVLKDANKNPSGCHRCWASINNPDDELWVISKELLECNAVIFFASTRWGSANAVYQKLIERLNWLENRTTTLNEDNIISHIEAGLILTGHNWNGSSALELQKQVLNFYGFRVPEELSFNWQWSSDATDESAEGYLEEPIAFRKKFGFPLVDRIVESFRDWIKK
jgi:multimeric flavodoxin WrbA